MPLAPPVMSATLPASLIRLSLNDPPVLVAYTARARAPARRRVSQRARTVYTAGRRVRLRHHGVHALQAVAGLGPLRPRRASKLRSDSMATYVLVHGAYQGGWIWKPVVDRLRAAGHEVFAP